ncbi:MAG: hypothetical protein Q9M31_03165 [Mariprofundus sp.]|nr:hypothetical protein [Mariprofundus sp.]
MNMIRKFLILFAIVLMASLAWFFLQKPVKGVTPNTVHTVLPKQNQSVGRGVTDERWRVVTRRLITRLAADQLFIRLQAMGLTPIKITGVENVLLHAFDDTLIYKSRQAALLAEQLWQEDGLETAIIVVGKARFMIGLGRLYQQQYAQELQEKLEKTGRVYRYQQRSMPIPSWRFTFDALDRTAADTLWKQLDESGVMMPVLISEVQFQSLYGVQLQGEDE